MNKNQFVARFHVYDPPALGEILTVWKNKRAPGKFIVLDVYPGLEFDETGTPTWNVTLEPVTDET
jgi:hypothetical protein